MPYISLAHGYSKCFTSICIILTTYQILVRKCTLGLLAWRTMARLVISTINDESEKTQRALLTGFL